MTHTQNYNLTQWDPTDRILREDFNTDNAAIDTALADHAAQLAKLPKLGNCQIYTTSYVGNGQCGKEHPSTLTFPRKPELVIIVGGSNGRPLCMIYGCPRAFLDTNGTASNNNTITWSGKTVTWYSEHVMSQMSDKNINYYVTMFCGMD